MTSGMTEVVTAIQRALDELPRRRAEVLATLASARTAYGEAVGATQDSNHSSPREALQSMVNGNLAAERAAEQFDAAVRHIEAYRTALDGGSGSAVSSSGAPGSREQAPRIDRPVSTLKTHGVTHGTVQRRAGAMDGPVIFSAADGMTPTETGQAQEYVDAANRANQGGRLSPTGRAKMDHQLKLDKLKAAAQERKRAKEAGDPYGKAVAAHLPDSTWVGRGEPPEGFGRHTNRVNSTLGSQSGCYPEGYKPTEFKLDDSWPDLDTQS